MMRLSIAQGKAKTLYGAGIHLLDVLKSGETNFDEKLDDTIRRYSSTFTKTSEVTFSTLSQESFICPQKPSTKPGSRGSEKRLRPAKEAPKGSSKGKSCSFCGTHASVKDCRQYLEFGRRITTDLERSSLTTSLLDVHKFGSKYSKFTIWPHVTCTTLHSGKPSLAKHIAVSGIFSWNGRMTSILVGDIRFLAEGGNF